MTTLYTTNHSLNATLKHDQHPDISYAFKAKTSPNAFHKDETNSFSSKEIEQEWPLWKEAIRTKFES